MDKVQNPIAQQKSSSLDGNENMRGAAPPSFQLMASDAPVAQRKGEKIGPAGVLSKGKGNIVGAQAPIYKQVGEARTATNALGHFAENAEIFILEDGGLGKGTHLFIYGEFTYAKGGTGKEYVWIEAGSVKPQEEAKAQTPAPAKQSGDTTEQKAETWRSIGNLRGNPPVRSEDPPNINVVEDEARYKELLAMAEESLKSITAQAEAMNITGNDVTDHRFWFAKVYQFVTEGELDFVKNKTFYYPSYVLLSVIYFEKIYRDNLAAGMKGAEAHWAEAFKRAEDGDNDDWVTFFYESAWNLVDSMLAHIRFDLPRAEAWIYNSYYKQMKGVKFDDFKTDFMSMGPIFDKAGQRMNGVIEEYNAIYGNTLAKLTPKAMQDWYMAYFEEADMGAERADTWKRAEMLVDGGLNTDDPYTIKDGKITGDVTKGKHRDNIDKLGDGMAPVMDEEAPEMSDNEVLEQLKGKSDSDIAKLPLSTRMRMLFGLMRYWTDNEDESALFRILDASTSDAVTLIDAVGAWNLLNVTDGDDYNKLRNYLVTNYYHKTVVTTAGGLIKVCADGETANWEETMIVDILRAWNGQAGYVRLVEMTGVNHILWNVDGDNLTNAVTFLKANYYPNMSEDAAVAAINSALDEYDTEEYQEEMIMDILEAHPNRRTIVTKIGESTGEEGDKFDLGIDKLKSTLDGGDQDRLETLFGL